jgi:hypothetical protein
VAPTSRRGTTAQRRSGFIRCYGLFWSVDEVSWFRDSEVPGPFRLLGRIGHRARTLQVCDFRPQRGIYVLYDDYGPYYVGLTRKRPLGDRLKRHLLDHHAGRWDRFSWFGFRPVLKGRMADGTRGLGKLPERLITQSSATIGDIEALLIQSLGTQHRGNGMEMRFSGAEAWTQLMGHEFESLDEKMNRPSASRARPKERLRGRRPARARRR